MAASPFGAHGHRATPPSSSSSSVPPGVATTCVDSKIDRLSLMEPSSNVVSSTVGPVGEDEEDEEEDEDKKPSPKVRPDS